MEEIDEKEKEQDIMNALSEDYTKICNILKELERQESREEIDENIYLSLFYGSRKYEEIKSEIRMKTGKQICGKYLDSKQVRWICKTCSKKIPNCSIIYCDECFYPSLHLGHKYSYHIQSTGCCDCGDPQTFNRLDTFCPKHTQNSNSNSNSNSPVDNISKYIEKVGPVILEHICQRIHNLLGEDTSWGLHLGLRKPKPQERTLRKLEGWLLVLAHIADVGSQFPTWVINTLKLSHGGGTLCAHTCTNINNTNSNPVSDASDVTPHPCECSTLDIIMKYLVLVSNNSSVCSLFAELATSNPEFRDMYLRAFWGNYSSIIALNKHRRSSNMGDNYENILVQCTSTEGEMAKSLRREEIIKSFMGVLSALVRYINIPSAKYKVQSAIATILTDFRRYLYVGPLMSKYLFEDTNFFYIYMEIIRGLQYSDRVVIRESHVENVHLGYPAHLSNIIYLITDIFIDPFRDYHIYNYSTLINIAAILKSTDIPSLDPQYYSAIIPINRITTYFLIRLIMLQYSDQETCLSGVNLQTIFEMEEEEFMVYLTKLGSITLRTINFISEVEIGNFKYYGESTMKELVNEYHNKWFDYANYDLALIQIILGIFPYNICIEHPMISLLSLKTIMSTPNTNLKDRLKHKLHFLSNLISNDLSFLSTYLRAKNTTSLIIGDEKCANGDLPIIKYTIKKYALQLMIKEELNYGLNIRPRMIKNKLMFFLRHKGREALVSQLYDQVETTSNAISPNCTFSVNLPGIKILNIFNHICLLKFIRAEDALFNLFKRWKGENVDIFENINKLPIIQKIHQNIINIFIEHQFLSGCLEIFCSSELIYAEELTKPFAFKIIYEIIHQMQADKAEFTKITEEFPYFKGKLIDFGEKNSLYTLPIQKIMDILYEKEDENIIDAKKPSTTPIPNKVKLMQEKIKQEFAKKRASFLEHTSSNTDMEIVEEIKNEGQEMDKHKKFTKVCSVCHERLEPNTYAKNPYGQPAFISLTNILNLAKFQNFMKKYSHKIMHNLPTEEELNNERELPPYLSVSKCKHYIHFKCGEKCWKHTEVNQTFFKEFECPVCKSYSNIILPIIPADTLNPSFTAIVKGFKEDLVEIFLSNHSVFPNDIHANHTLSDEVFLGLILYHIQLIRVIGLNKYIEHRQHKI